MSYLTTNITKQGLLLTNNIIEQSNIAQILKVYNSNLGNTSASYSNMNFKTSYAATAWGGDAGTVTYYPNGGFKNLPYKVYHKTATGSGGIYKKTADDIIIKANTTYTMSVYIKGSIAYQESAYGFNINRGSDNHYINFGKDVPITTEWQRISRTFTTSDTENGNYGEMSIIYNDNATDFYVYYCGFKIEEGAIATPWDWSKEESEMQSAFDCNYYYEI